MVLSVGKEAERLVGRYEFLIIEKSLYWPKDDLPASFQAYTVSGTALVPREAYAEGNGRSRVFLYETAPSPAYARKAASMLHARVISDGGHGIK